MRLQEHDPLRKHFQIDRISFFSDAIFAIAITLLVIDVKAPEIKAGSSSREILQQLIDLTPKFVGFIVSFFVIALFWRSHHRIFGFVSAYSKKMMSINTMLLFTIAFMPFSTAYYSENFGYNIPFYFYWGNILLTEIFNYWLIVYVFDPKNELVVHMPSKKYLSEIKMTAAIGIFVFVLGIVLCPFFPLVSRFWFLTIWPLSYLASKLYSKRNVSES